MLTCPWCYYIYDLKQETQMAVVGEKNRAKKYLVYRLRAFCTEDSLYMYTTFC